MTISKTSISTSRKVYSCWDTNWNILILVLKKEPSYKILFKPVDLNQEINYIITLIINKAETHFEMFDYFVRFSDWQQKTAPLRPKSAQQHHPTYFSSVPSCLSLCLSFFLLFTQFIEDWTLPDQFRFSVLILMLSFNIKVALSKDLD